MSNPQRRPRRRLRKALVAAGVLLAVAVVLVALAPTLVSRGVGQGIIRERIEGRVSGTVSLGTVRLGWFGPQSVKGFELAGADGATSIRADATLDAGLLDLVLGRVETVAVELAGRAHGELRRDGSTSFDDLLRAPAPDRAPARRDDNTQPPRLPALAGVPAATVTIAGFTVTLAEQGAPQKVIRLNDLKGELRYTPGAQAKVDLTGGVGDGVSAGSVHVAGHVDGLYDAGGAVTPARASGRLEVQVRNFPVPLTEQPTEVGTMSLVATTDDPTDRVDVAVDMVVNIDGTPTGNLTGALGIERPVDTAGMVTLGLDRVTGRVVGESMPTAMLQRFLRGTPIVATRDLGPVLDVTADFSSGTTRRVVAAARTETATLDFEGTVGDEQRIKADRCRVEAALRPELVREMTGVKIDRDAGIIVDLDTLELDEGMTAKGTLRLREPVAVTEGPAAPLLADLLDESLVVNMDATYGQGKLSAKLGARGDGLVAHATGTLRGSTIDVIEAVASVQLTPAQFAALQDSGDPVVLEAPARVTLQLSPLTAGPDATPAPIRARVGLYDAAFAAVPVVGELSVGGDFAVTLAGAVISIGAEGVGVKVPKAALQKRMGTEVTVAADVPMTLDIRSLRLPRAALSGEQFNGADADIDLELRGGPVVLDDTRVGRNTVKDIRLTLAGGDLGAALTAKLTGDVEFTGASEPGRLELDGTVTDLMSGGRLAASGATLALTARVDGLHTGVVDGLADMQGLLVAAIGPRVDAVADAHGFSRTSGTLDASITASNGWLKGQVAGRGNAAVVDAAAPIQAELELTPPLRQRLLYKINPILADIRTTEQPMRATIGASTIPLDGDVSRLDAKILITIGKVEFDSGSRTLGLLTLAKAANAKTMPGEITPIKATITKGVLTYDEPFIMKIDKYTLVYDGTINLNTRYVDLTTHIPLDGLAGTFHELEGYTENVAVPILYRGPFGDVQPVVEPEFLAKAAAEVGVRKGLDELGKKTGVPIKDILDGFLGKKKKK